MTTSSRARYSGYRFPAEIIGHPADGEPSYDQPCRARRGVIRRADGRFEHFCAVCGAWGGWGFGVTGAAPGR